MVPQRGEKAELVTNALRNARESLARRMAESATQMRLLEGVAEAFDLPTAPRRIEVYDNSHIMGTNAVGAMIVAGPEGFVKKPVPQVQHQGTEMTPGDDFGMMKEVLTRRFARLLKEDPDRQSEAWPDLLLIDGGAGQVSAVHEIMAEMGVEDIAMVGVAKGQRPRPRQGGVPPAPASAPSPCARTTRCCISCSACATRPTVGPSARIAPSAPNRPCRTPWTKSRAWGPRGNARC